MTTTQQHPAEDEPEAAKSQNLQATGLENDLESLSWDPASCLPKIVELSKLTFERSKAQEWAYKDIKFLVYDDTDDGADVNEERYDNDLSTPAAQTSHDHFQAPPENITKNAVHSSLHSHDYDSDDEDEKLSYALGLSLEGNPNHESAPEASGSQSSRTKDSKKPCPICCKYPEFPYKSKARKFRVVKPEVTGIYECTHYVAISYCWPPYDEPRGPSTYSVRDLDGQQRLSRALDDVIDRAVDFANSLGLRMIWIDQECLPQPQDDSSQVDKDEQQLGVQSMDIVYNRATITAGLLNVQIHSQSQLDAIVALTQYDISTIQRIADQEFICHILDFLYRTSQDRWYTRAWVIQESICAGNGLYLAFRLGPGLRSPSDYRSGPQPADRPLHSLDLNPRKHISKLFIIPLRKFWIVMDRTNPMFAYKFSRSVQYSIQDNNGPEHTMREAGHILETVHNLHPRFRQVHLSLGEMNIFCTGHYGKRPTIDGVTALTLLKQRNCHKNSDQLAILANMCDYDFRLDTGKIDSNCESLGQAMFTLILNNGDLSILVPEAYSSSQRAHHAFNEAEISSKSVLFRDFARMKWIDHAKVQNNIHARLQTVHPGRFTSKGLQLPAYLWTVDKEIDFFPMKLKWADKWNDLKSWHIGVRKQDGESDEQNDHRKKVITHRFMEPAVGRQAHQEFARHGHIPDNSTIWDGIDHRGVHVDRVLISKHFKCVPKVRNTVTEVIFDILRYIITISDDRCYAQGLADSIWHSIRVDQVGKVELPDQVTNALFLHEDVISQPYNTLQLHEDKEQRLSQLWFAERIMNHGSLWCGRYIRSGRQYPAKPAASARHLETSEAGPSSLSGPSQMTGATTPQARPQTILERAATRAMLCAELNSLLVTHNDEYSKSEIYPLMAFMEIVVKDSWSSSAEDRRESTLVSTFDVDGPCTVATPYNPNWEVLPRPELRNMSTCWVVEPVKSEHETSDEESQTSAQSEKSRGKRKASEMDDTCGLSDMDKEPSETDHRPLGTYDVLRKVKGLWEIMNLPSQEYIFR
ncbi:hypothetical protein OPT61_g9257 [Boeremia exigua]|uniref:Uncharacterized protein n=1 Tax=Boeremia exigua TaxID=749465 RepID=A0ACC2HVA2_9PLEO|nr:hypothetical protein OPT61_g9257 [Boeremia exigua]